MRSGAAGFRLAGIGAGVPGLSPKNRELIAIGSHGLGIHCFSGVQIMYSHLNGLDNHLAILTVMHRPTDHELAKKIDDQFPGQDRNWALSGRASGVPELDNNWLKIGQYFPSF